ncbi:hypothetical protein ACF3MZ_09970 [Paenibacillaceae bacterium WGS1546]|uniref:hypothetical protein n=1 Tax=Cohnella sp. WGS1546 TaxID=3366810 RepID=UPI00372D3D06
MPINGERIAKWISILFHPFLVAAPVFLIVSLSCAPRVADGLLWWAIIAIGVSAGPFAFISRGVRRGKWTDSDLSVREQRLVPFLVTIGCMAAVWLVLLALNAAGELLAAFAGMTFAVVSALLITHLAKWKISLHLIGITGAVLAIGLLASPIGYALAPLIPLVGWARWKVRAHTPAQAAAGAALAAFATLAAMALFGVGAA